jgi:hypothetical protein
LRIAPALACHLIKVRRFNFGLPVGANVAIAQVIGQYKDDIWLCGDGILFRLLHCGAARGNEQKAKK